jgi:hypothetical protein
MLFLIEDKSDSFMRGPFWCTHQTSTVIPGGDSDAALHSSAVASKLLGIGHHLRRSHQVELMKDIR